MLSDAVETIFDIEEGTDELKVSRILKDNRLLPSHTNKFKVNNKTIRNIIR